MGTPNAYTVNAQITSRANVPTTWTARTEYLYVDLGNANANAPVSPDNVSLKENIVRAGVNYRF